MKEYAKGKPDERRWRLTIAKAIDSIQSHTTSHPTSFAQKGALAAYKGPQDCVAEMKKEYDKRHTEKERDADREVQRAMRSKGKDE